jgi:hypothetical protein
MAQDGIADAQSANASNMFRIWACVKDGVVQDADGKPRQQIRKYFKGLGADLDLIPRIFAGITGSGFEVLIFKVYKASLRSAMGTAGNCKVGDQGC